MRNYKYLEEMNNSEIRNILHELAKESRRKSYYEEIKSFIKEIKNIFKESQLSREEIQIILLRYNFKYGNFSTPKNRSLKSVSTSVFRQEHPYHINKTKSLEINALKKLNNKETINSLKNILKENNDNKKENITMNKIAPVPEPPNNNPKKNKVQTIIVIEEKEKHHKKILVPVIFGVMLGGFIYKNKKCKK